MEKERNEQLTGSAPPDTDPQSCLKIELSEQAEEGEQEEKEKEKEEDEEEKEKEAGEQRTRRTRSCPSVLPETSSQLSKSDQQEQDSDSPMEISITAGFSLPEDGSPRKAKRPRRQERKPEKSFGGETFRQVFIINVL